MKRKEKIRASLNALFQKVEEPTTIENEVESSSTESAEIVAEANEFPHTENNVHTPLIAPHIQEKLDKIALIRNQEIEKVYEEALSFYLEFQLDIPEE